MTIEQAKILLQKPLKEMTTQEKRLARKAIQLLANNWGSVS